MRKADTAHTGATLTASRSAPRALLVDTSVAGATGPSGVWDGILDYAAVSDRPRWLKSLEESARFDFSLARKALEEAQHFDILVAGSEKVGIPLGLMRPPRPVICVVHQIASPGKRRFLDWLNIPARWTRIGYQCQADRDLLASFYGVPTGRLIQFITAPLGQFRPVPCAEALYVLSAGTSKRDYRTLLSAVDQLPGVTTRVYASSRFLDPYRGRMPAALRSWVEFREPVATTSMPDVYRLARFVVLPIEQTHQYSAGATVALEAHAAGRAIVATRTPGMSDFIVDGVTGFLVPVGDAGAMRAAIARLWNDPRLAGEMGLAGRAHVEKHFDPAIVDAKIRQAYAEACAEFRAF